MATVKEFAAFVEANVGDAYRLGYEVSYGKWPLADPSDTWDCSELVEVSYGHFGVRIRDLAAWQYEDTAPVTASPKTGDLVFLKNNPDRPHGIGHVGILTRPLMGGDWRIVEAKGRDYGVVFSTLSAWKRKSTFAGIRRHADFKNHVSEVTPSPVHAAYIIHGLADDAAHYKAAAAAKNDYIGIRVPEPKDSFTHWHVSGFKPL